MQTLLKIKNFWEKKRVLMMILLALIFTVFVFLESVKVNCEYLDGSETCNVLGKFPYRSLLAALFIAALWGVTTVCGIKILNRIKAFGKRRPIVTTLIVIAFFGMFPFPVRCTQTVMPQSYSISPGDDLRLLLLNDLPLQNSQCYFAPTKEYWMPKKPTLGMSTGPLLGFLIANLKSDN